MLIKHEYLLSTLVLLFFITILSGCGTLTPYYGKNYRDWPTLDPPDTTKLTQSIFLIGDAGTLDNNPVLNLMNRQLKIADSLISNGDTSKTTKNTVIFLGDNIYYYGLPEKDASDRDEKEEIINNQMNSLEGFKGNKIFIPGNHDWRASTKGGLEAVNRQEQYIEVYADSTIDFLPNLGCPGPYELHLSENMVILIIDSEWWLTPHEKPIGPENGCFVDDRFDFIVQFQDAVQRNSDKNILIVQHHPLFSNSNHGGRFSLFDNIFPLTLVRDNLYIPLPLIGSLYPLLRKYGVSRQDIPNPLYQEYISEILSVIEDKPNVIFAAGHDHNLQLTKYNELSHIVSGSGGKTNFAARRGETSYVQQVMGFARLNYYDNETVWVEFWTANEENPEGILTFKYPLYSLEPPTDEDLEEQEIVSYEDSSKYVVAGEEYKAGKLKKFFLGDNYRLEWTTPVKIPYLDMKTEAGGLSPINKAGTNQTIALTLLSKDSVQYDLQALKKQYPILNSDQPINSFSEDPIQHQISTSHPYGALAIPKMAEALNIFHTDPVLFYTPYTNLLGPYIDDFGGALSFLEIKPTNDLSEFKSFGYSENVVTTRTLFRQLELDSKNKVDHQMFLRNRLFDMLLNDWDRSENQWRWSEINANGEGLLYKPLARDRDQVFTTFDGIIPYLISRKWGIRNYQHFDHHINDVIGLNLSAKNLDRQLLSHLSKEDWISEAENIQKQLTDEVLANAIADMPEEVAMISGDVIVNKLKSRRDNIEKWAIGYYKILARDVDIAGSNKNEYVIVETTTEKEAIVKVYIMEEGDIKQEIYNRTFYEDETDEIRVYGKGGQDSIVVSGVTGNQIKIRIIGGAGEDAIIDKSKGSKVFIYDQTTEENNIVAGTDTKLKTSKDPDVNEHDSISYQYDYNGPRLNVEYNVDEGIKLGVGMFIRRNAFRKNPMTTHLLMANHAFNTSSFEIEYEGNFYSLLGRNWDLSVKALFLGPEYKFNYFGMGNGTLGKLESINHYRINMSSFKVSPSINYRFSDFFKIGFGPAYEHLDFKDNQETIIHENGSQLSSTYNYLGGNFFADLNILDYKRDPTRGVKWFNSINNYYGLNGEKFSFTNLNTDVSVFITPNLPLDITTAIRFGASTTWGNFNFFQSQFIGGNTNLRGYRNNRFSGRSSMYNNTEIRWRLFNITNPVFTGNYGILGFIDSGRVWSESGEKSKKWHRAYGPGIWVNFYKLFLLSGTVAFSAEGEFINIQIGHYF